MTGERQEVDQEFSKTTLKQYNYTVDKGTYILAMKLDKPAEITIGKLGRFTFPSGHYLYFGSAMNGLHARISRHLRSDKKLHWHIDYLLKKATIVDIWHIESGERLECELCQEAMRFPGASVPVKGFGASDCRCSAHLLKLNDNKTIVKLLFEKLRTTPMNRHTIQPQRFGC